MANLLEQHGAQPQKQPKYVPLFIDRTFTGLYTQRNVLHDPSDFITSKFYGGRPDALWQGSNIELTNRLTLQRRPGLSEFSTVLWPTAPDRAFSFQLLNGTIQVIIDTTSTGSLSLTGVAASIGGNAVYTGVITGGAVSSAFPSGAFVGMLFTVTGFTGVNNNGTFVCVASTGTTLTLANAFATLESSSAAAISAGAVYIDNQNGTATLLFAKSVGAGQTYFVAVAGILYMGDGVDTRKYTPGNPNGSVWNFGGAAPVAQPGIVITEAAVSAAAWQASTWFSTMGIIVDSNGNAEQLVSVNFTGVNATQFGTSGNGSPAWNQTPGGSTTDGSITWENKGPVGVWAPNATYSASGSFGTAAAPAVIYDVNSNAYYQNARDSGTFTSGSVKPPFNGVIGSHYFDGPGGVHGSINWVCMGAPSGSAQVIAQWQRSTAYSNPLPGGLGWIIEPVSPPSTSTINPITSFAQAVTTNGTSAASYSAPNWSTITGGPTYGDGDLNWVNLGSVTWAPTTAYSAWTSPNSNSFSCVVDPTTNQMYVCIQTGISGSSTPWVDWVASAVVAPNTTIIDSNGNKQFTSAGGTSKSGTHPVWATTYQATTTDNTVTWINLSSAYGFTTTDGTVIWVCVGNATTWTQSQIYYLPKVGFSPPTASSAYGGAAVLDTNSDEEFVIETGVSGLSMPSWAAPGDFTLDNTVLWHNVGPAITKFISWTVGYNWAYSYKARTLTDFYSVDVTGTNEPPVPPGLSNPLPAPTGSETGLITTASPATTIIGGNAGAQVTIYGQYSADPQFDTIVIWRSADGGSSAEMFELTEIPNIPSKAGTGAYVINGIKYDWAFVDFLPDTPTALYPGLNPLIPAPIDGLNNPPLSGFLPMVYNFNRIWGADEQNVLFSDGPDALNVGNPNEQFNPTNELPFLADVVRLVKTPVGLVTFLTDSIEIIAGGPSTTSFFSVTLAPGTGLLSYNMLDQFAGDIYFFSSDNRFLILNPGTALANSGFPLGDQFANLPSSGISDAIWNPAAGYVASLQNGTDNAIFVADGSTGWYRQNPHQVPGSAQGPEPIWSPYANITNGCKMVQTVETAPGIRKLLVGGTGPGKKILYRNQAIFTDDGTAYDAWFTMGSIMLVHHGQLAVVKFIEGDFSGVKYTPTISYLLNEISGTFTKFSLLPQFDPPSIYGSAFAPTSYSPNRYYFSGTGKLARCVHLQVKVDLGTRPTGDELYNLTIFGRMFVET